MGMPRDKTRPANPQSGTHREKTRPARQNSAVLAFFRSAGRKISRFLRRHSKQGEFSRADHHTLATQRTPTVQNSPGTQRVRPQPVQNSPRTRRVRPQPVQNSPRTAKNTQISPFEASREKIIPVETRSRHKQPTQGEFYPANHHTLATLGTLTGTKLSPHAPTQAPTGTKLSPHSKKHPNQPIRGEQGENYPGRDPLETQTTDAGRILSRKPPHTSHAGHTHRYKTLRAHSV